MHKLAFEYTVHVDYPYNDVAVNERVLIHPDTDNISHLLLCITVLQDHGIEADYNKMAINLIFFLIQH